MPDQAVKNPPIRQGWLRIILFGIAFVVVTIILMIILVVAIMGANLDKIKTNPKAALAGFLTDPAYPWLVIGIETAASILTVFIFWRWIDRKPFNRLGFSITDHSSEALTGLFTGPALLGIVALVMMLSGHLSWVDITFDGNALFLALGLMVLVAVSEELVFRGYILSNLLETFAGKDEPNNPKGKYIALIVSAFLFAIFHLGNPGMNTLAFINLILAGLLLGVNYIYTQNLWFSMAFHLTWNFFQGPVMGFRVSGLNLPSLLQIETKGDLMLTGGDFGLEGSILDTGITFLAFFLFAWAFERKYNSGNAAMA